MNTYLITGGAGFIGANFVKYMRQVRRGDALIVLDSLTYAGNLQTIENELNQIIFIKGSINDSKLLEEIFIAHNPNIVINFAAESHVDRSIHNPRVFLETNIMGVQSLLESAKHFWAIDKDSKGYPLYKENCRFIQVSTDEVYGSLSRDYPVAKKLELSLFPDRHAKTYGSQMFTETTPICPHSPYSASKASADLIVQAYGDTYHMPINITRCSNNYGPYQFPEKLIPLMIKNALEGKNLPVYGEGKNVRDWLYVEDHCKAILAVVEKGRMGEVYNIGGFNEKENIEIVNAIIQKLSINDPTIDKSRISYVQDRLGHDARYAIDPSKIVTELGWFPETTFDIGIEKTIQWYLSNKKWINTVISGDYTSFYNKYYNSNTTQ